MQRLIKSFRYAGAGLLASVKTEKNFQLHCIAAVIAVAMGFAFTISAAEWLLISLCIGLVLAFEMMNTVAEQLCNLVHPGFHPVVKRVKDISAAAVLVIALASLACGCIIFLPKIFTLF